MTIEKRGVIQHGLTLPEDDKPAGEKCASLADLEDNAVKRMAKVAQTVRTQQHLTDPRND